MNQVPLNMDISGSKDTVPVEKKNASKKKNLIRVPRLKLRLYLTESFKEIRPHDKI